MYIPYALCPGVKTYATNPKDKMFLQFKSMKSLVIFAFPNMNGLSIFDICHERGV